MKISVDQRGRVQISVSASVMNMSPRQAEVVLADLTAKLDQAKANQATHLAAVAEAHSRMAEALA